MSDGETWDGPGFLESTGDNIAPPPVPLHQPVAPVPRSSTKRTRSAGEKTSISTPPPLNKKLRQLPKSSYVLDPTAFKPGGFTTRPVEPPSPLFWSNSPIPKRRPILPASIASTEAIAMLNKPRDESSGVTTLKLARGNISNSSPPRSLSSPGSWVPLGRGSTPRSPDPNADPAAFKLLAGIGVLELLEQDQRLVFIVDIGTPQVRSPDSLHVLFTNSALKTYDSVLDAITGSVAINDFAEFRAWALSFVRNNESLDVCLPKFKFANVTWSCSTLKRRLRVISGDGSELPKPLDTGRTSSVSTSSPSRFQAPTRTTNFPASPLREMTETHDYFGSFAVESQSKHDTTATPIDDIDIPDAVGTEVTSADLPYNAGLGRSVTQEISSFDWTRLPMSSSLPEHIQFARSIDWASTSLGPIETWNYDLRLMCNLVMASPHPAAFYWGKDYIAIYNEAYVLLAGKKHPALMGQSYKVAWAEIWSEIEPVFESAIESGQATMKDDDCLFVNRRGYMEECYFSWSIVPLVGEDGSVAGLYNPAFEKTTRNIAERRMHTLREVGERTAIARELKQFWAEVVKGLESNEADVPFAYLYSVSDDSESDHSSIHSGSLAAAPQCVLEATLGVPPNHPTTVTPIDLRNGDQSWAPYLREAAKTASPVLLTTNDVALSLMVENLAKRGFDDPCRSVVVCPIHPTTGETILGFLVLGTNPRRPYDDDYQLFIQLLSRQLATSMASVCLFEEEIRRGQRAARLAALDRIELSKQLDLRTQEAVESETKFTRMAEFAPVGMFIASSTGTITYSNETWWDITRHNREDGADTWLESVKDEDRAGVNSMWNKVVDQSISITHEFRVKAPWQDPNGNRAETWLLMSAYPETHLSGELKSVFGSLTNISQQKWAEDFQKRRMEEAIELKRQQENFIDITSHEMRNPLGAVLLSSEEISTSLIDYKQSDRSKYSIDEIIDSTIDAAQTITLCAQHQKRIVDDVLTLSKLDSALLLVTPVDVQPTNVVRSCLSMLEGEANSGEISLSFKLDQSYTDLGIDWVKLDPSRLSQVLINLITNAIKFTRGQGKRNIVVGLSASQKRPVTTGNPAGLPFSIGGSSNVMYFPTRAARKNATVGDNWQADETLYLTFYVQDTGRGLDEEEKKLLFIRFSQTSPRTHVMYGGSGLGLFISRELTELQGGEIGVASEKGVGSTFTFYIKALKLGASGNSDTVTSNTWEAGHAKHKAASPRSDAQSKTPRSSAPKLKRTESQDLSTFNILIVEDNLVNQRVLQKQLRNLGCTTHVANHGGEALEVLQKSKFWKGNEQDGIDLTVVLLDVEMPVMDGLTCARKIRELEADGTIISHVPIIAVSANARTEQINTALVAGMDSVVSKPFRIPDLIAMIKELVNRFPEDKPGG